MKSDKKLQYNTRDAVMSLLSDDEVARVSMAETASSLEVDDEYVDLEQLDQGVCKATAAKMPKTPMGHVLPRKAVHESTWNKIVARLSAA